MNAEVDDGEGGQEREPKHRVPISVPPAVVIKTSQAKPNGERDTDVERRHTVGERIDAAKPIGYFWRQRVGERFHAGNGVPRHSNVEEEVEGNGKDVHPSNR